MQSNILTYVTSDILLLFMLVCEVTFYGATIMSKIIAVANQKGGVGKTTTAVNLAGALARQGRRVLLVDTDSQANATFALTASRTCSPSIYHLLTNLQTSLDSVIKPANEPNIDVIPSDQQAMKSIERELSGVVGEQTLLYNALRGLPEGKYDFVVIDTPPHIGPLMINAIVASDRVIIPVQPGVFSLQGIKDVQEIVGLAISRLGRSDLRVLGILVNFREYTNVTKDTVEILKSTFDGSLFTAQIPKNVTLEEAHSRGGSVFQYDPSSPGSAAFEQLAQEVVERYD